VNPEVASTKIRPKAEPVRSGRRQRDVPQCDRSGRSLRRGGRGSTVARTCRATGETVLVPPGNRVEQGDRITGENREVDCRRNERGNLGYKPRVSLRGPAPVLDPTRLEFMQTDNDGAMAPLYLRCHAGPGWRRAIARICARRLLSIPGTAIRRI